MLAYKAAEHTIDIFAPANQTVEERANKKIFAANTLQRARHFYVAKLLATPSLLIPNNRLTLIRKLGWLLILFQILDGLFTLLGINTFGVEIEGNPLVRNFIEIVGPSVGILFVKLATIIIIFCICVFGCKVKWITPALSGVAYIYFLFALAPWTIVFGSYYGTSLGLWN